MQGLALTLFVLVFLSLATGAALITLVIFLTGGGSYLVLLFSICTSVLQLLVGRNAYLTYCGIGV
jgi:hypothetical protein